MGLQQAQSQSLSMVLSVKDAEPRSAVLHGKHRNLYVTMVFCSIADEQHSMTDCITLDLSATQSEHRLWTSVVPRSGVPNQGQQRAHVVWAVNQNADMLRQYSSRNRRATYQLIYHNHQFLQRNAQSCTVCHILDLVVYGISSWKVSSALSAASSSGWSSKASSVNSVLRSLRISNVRAQRETPTACMAADAQDRVPVLTPRAEAILG